MVIPNKKGRIRITKGISPLWLAIIAKAKIVDCRKIYQEFMKGICFFTNLSLRGAAWGEVVVQRSNLVVLHYRMHDDEIINIMICFYRN